MLRLGCVSSAAAAPAGLQLLVFLGSAGAQPQLTSEQNAISLSAGKYRHLDRATNQELICDKCPAGTYVSKHCTKSTLRECSPCPDGTFTKHENGIERCHPCRKPCELPMIEKTHCTALTDRECTCLSGTFQTNDTCVPYTVCPVGWGVRKKGTETEDVRCKPCPRGTFSDVPSSVMKCKTYTDCFGKNMVVVKPGTKESDNVCGSPASLPSTSLASSDAEAGGETYKAPPTAHLPKGLNSSVPDLAPSPPPAAYGATGPMSDYNQTLANETGGARGSLVGTGTAGQAQSYRHKHASQALEKQPALEMAGGEKSSMPYRPPRRGPQNVHQHFDINEHLPWMIVLFLLLVLVVIVVCSVRKSSRTLKKGPRQDPSAIVEKAIMKKSTTPTQNREKWIYYCNGHGIDILKLVAAQVGSQWKDIYQFLCNASEREVAAFSNGYAADHERAYAALQHWTIRGPEASLAQLISALRQHRRNDVVEKIRGLMEDTTSLEGDKLALPVNPSPLSPAPSPSPKPPEAAVLTVEPSPSEKKCFFVDESEPLLRCDSTSSGSSALSRTGSFITKEKKDTVLRQVRLDPCDLQPIFDDMLHILNPEELHVIEEIPQAEDKLDRLFEIAGVKSQEASQTLLDSVYSHLPDLL
ncbi:tumor necrosis factor receptor superfamily member 21-like isoform X5 [Oxyura jamaicensis]|uniref:tumor necrosis factor receptor superfamily member 21-like isoform X5 n=1 Tax=Oxyura jamaicensis TaxID=8884 RepID=UPI0015A50D42|nr:tumor necrosis factor receptor superfamily member 21-like isoform X5 [Oxyura jamaicensis]XP_035167301.1 tumor necrosis factor receptor superfamily member 21-like isoform X5 [Oxyura jamaicensis]